MPTYDEIIRSLKQRKPQRVYLLAGDEPLFIDQIASFAAKELIPAEEQDFNQSILYGAEVNARTILLEALRFPMMGSQVPRLGARSPAGARPRHPRRPPR